jgi:hypothetical protein
MLAVSFFLLSYHDSFFLAENFQKKFMVLSSAFGIRAIPRSGREAKLPMPPESTSDDQKLSKFAQYYLSFFVISTDLFCAG